MCKINKSRKQFQIGPFILFLHQQTTLHHRSHLSNEFFNKEKTTLTGITFLFYSLNREKIVFIIYNFALSTIYLSLFFSKNWSEVKQDSSLKEKCFPTITWYLSFRCTIAKKKESKDKSEFLGNEGWERCNQEVETKTTLPHVVLLHILFDDSGDATKQPRPWRVDRACIVLGQLYANALPASVHAPSGVHDRVDIAGVPPGGSTLN